MAVIRGKNQAELAVGQFERGQSAEDRHAGWRYFLEQSDLKPGMNPQEATTLRQTLLETREANAPPFPDPSPNSRHN
jgi:hypothetical protein